MTDVVQFRGQWRFLSNFYFCDIEYQGDTYPSVEHAYQAAKTLNLSERRIFQHPSTSAAEAKQLGKTVTLQENWHTKSLKIMEDLCYQKFSNYNVLRNALCEIEGEIIEGNTWGDTFWGECPLGNGENHLGKILMRVRDRLINESK